MKIIITNHMLSIVPYLSTHWNHINSMHVRDQSLVIVLSHGETVTIPKLSPEVIEKIFTAHAFYLERVHKTTTEAETQAPQAEAPPPPFPSLTSNPWQDLMKQFEHGLPGELWKGMHVLFQHSSEHADSPTLPQDALKKLSSIAQMLGPEEIANLPEPEPHCNCYHCQMMRAIHEKVNTSSREHPTEEATAEEEPFLAEPPPSADWNIEQTGDKLFHVTSRADPTESYNVFLGEPVGCTCGKRGCVHVLAVLRS